MMSRPNVKWQGLTAKEALAKLRTDAATGLAPKAARLRYRKGGANTLFDSNRATVFGFWKPILTDPALYLLLLSALLALAFSELAAGLCALACLIVGVLFALYLHRRTKRLEEKTEKYRVPYVCVLRDGKRKLISARRVVMGDILLLREGDIIPADCRLLESCGLTVHTLLPDEKGQPSWLKLPKDADAVYPYGSAEQAPHFSNLLYGGSLVIAGEARALVVATGSATFLGAIPSFRIPCEIHTGKRRESTAFLRFYLKIYSIALLLLLIPLTVVGIFTLAGKTSLTSLFLSLCALLGGASAGILQAFFGATAFHAREESFYQAPAADRAVFKSPQAGNVLATLDEVFVLGSCGVSDGLPHLFRAATGKGELPLEPGASYHILQPLCEAMLLLLQAYRQADESELRAPDFCDESLRRELISAADFDEEAMQVRLRALTLASTASDGTTVLEVQAAGEFYRLHFSYTADAWRDCAAFETDDTRLPMDAAACARLAEFYRSAIADGGDVITVKREQNGKRLLLGVIATREEIQETLPTVLQTLFESGIRTTFFFTEDSFETRRYLASAGLLEQAVTRKERLASGLSSGAQLARHRVFLGADTKEIHSLLETLQKEGKTVAVMSNHTEQMALLRRADLAMITDRTDYHLIANESALTEEVQTAGNANSTRATQSARRLADVIVSRASREGGGLSALLQAVLNARKARVRMRALIPLLLSTQLLRLCLTAASVCFGTGLLGGAQLLLGGMLLEATFVLWLGSLPIPKAKLVCACSFGEQALTAILGSRRYWIPITTASAGCVLYAFVACLAGWMTQDAARAFLFGSLMLLSVMIFVFTVKREGISFKNRKSLYFFSFLLLPLIIAFTLCGMFGSASFFAGFGSVTLVSSLSLPMGCIFYLLSYLFTTLLSHRTTE